jgi:hypothetical protein
MPEWELFDPDEERDAGIPAIARAIQEKVAKRYKPAPNLLVYVNFLLFDRLNFSISEMQSLVDMCRDHFPSTWLLWGEDVAQIWPRQFKVRKRSGANSD